MFLNFLGQDIFSMIPVLNLWLPTKMESLYEIIKPPIETLNQCESREKKCLSLLKHDTILNCSELEVFLQEKQGF